MSKAETVQGVTCGFCKSLEDQDRNLDFFFFFNKGRKKPLRNFSGKILAAHHG